MFGWGLLGKGPSTIDKIEMLFTDVETKWKKQGYERAVKLYEPIYRAIEEEFKETIDLIEKEKNTYGNQALKLNKKLEDLERQRQSLENQRVSIGNDVAKKYNIPFDEITSKSCFQSHIFTINILDMCYSYKKKKLLQAEQRGYFEATELYEEKFQKLRDDLYRRIKKGNRDKELLQNMILQILDDMFKEEMKIAELRILLKE